MGLFILPEEEQRG